MRARSGYRDSGRRLWQLFISDGTAGARVVVTKM